MAGYLLRSSNRVVVSSVIVAKVAASATSCRRRSGSFDGVDSFQHVFHPPKVTLAGPRVRKYGQGAQGGIGQEKVRRFFPKVDHVVLELQSAGQVDAG
jgi:hypothetical protein